jgi:hypothetical protein
MVNRRQQQGVVTLIFTAIVLVLASLVAAYSARSIFLEQDLTNNHARARAAFEVAAAGLEAAKSQVLGAGGTGSLVFSDTDADGVPDFAAGNIDDQRVEVRLVPNPADALEYAVVSTGYSDDRSAVHTIEQIILKISALPSPGDVPIVNKGNLMVSGSATIHNPEGHSTIWGGSEVDLGSNNATATYIPDLSDSGYPNCMDTSMTCLRVRSSTKLAVGLDVIENDTNLANLSPEQLFQAFFGLSPTDYRNTFAYSDNGILTDAANVNTDADLATDKVIWVDGDVEFGGITVGCEVSVTGSNLCTDNPPDVGPSIVIVNGDATFNGGNFTGLLFVIGDVHISGNMTVVGQMVVAGSTDSSAGASLDLYFNSDLLKEAGEIGVPVPIAGSWKDF